MDGEGTISHAATSHNWRISIVQKDEAVLRWIQNVTGAGGVRRRRNLGHGLARPRAYDDIHVWSLSGWSASLLLRQVLPYMRVKQQRAAEMLSDYPSSPAARLRPITGSDEEREP